MQARRQPCRWAERPGAAQLAVPPCSTGAPYVEAGAGLPPTPPVMSSGDKRAAPRLTRLLAPFTLPTPCSRLAARQRTSVFVTTCSTVSPADTALVF
jgi:hypothetical protein